MSQDDLYQDAANSYGAALDRLARDRIQIHRIKNILARRFHEGGQA